MSRIAVFVDVPSMWFDVRRFGESIGVERAQLDYRKLRAATLDAEDTCVGVYAYIANPDGEQTKAPKRLESFSSALLHMGYCVKQVKGFGQVTTAIQGDMAASCAEYDEAVVVAGEGDYRAIFKTLVDLGKTPTLCTFNPDDAGAPVTQVMELNRDLIMKETSGARFKW